MKQVVDAIRLQMVNWPLRYAWPVGLLILVLGFNLAIFAVLDANIADDFDRVTGAILTIYITAGVTYVVAFSQYFPFAVGLGVTRRAFYAGVVLLAVVESLAFGLLLVLFGLLERATDGWGLQLQFFDLTFLRAGDPLSQWVVYTGPFLVLAAVFALTGSIFKRWGQTGVWALILASTVLFGGLAVLITGQGWWLSLGEWFAGQPVPALFGGYPLVLAALALATGWLVIRRATV